MTSICDIVLARSGVKGITIAAIQSLDLAAAVP